MWMSLCFVLMDSPEEAVKSVNPREQGLPVFDPLKYVRSESHARAEPNEKKI